MGWSTEAIAKGVIAEKYAKIYFMSHGLSVLTPETHEKPYDFVIEHNGEYSKVQVKSEVIFGNLVRFRNKHGAANAKYSVKDYDILAGVWVERKKIYLFYSKDINEKEYGESLTVETVDGTPLRIFNRPIPYRVAQL
jgi:hypothetical protein